MDNIHKKHALIICSVPCILILLALANYVVDPLQIFRTRNDIGFYSDQRFQNSGLIYTYLSSAQGFSSVIIGTSLSENFDTNLFEQEGGIKALRLTMSGGYWKEHEIVAKAALATDKTQHVFWELWSNTYMLDNPRPYKDPRSFPDRLYSDSQLSFTGWASYLIDGTTTALSMQLIKDGAFNSDTLRNYAQWMELHLSQGRFLDYNTQGKMDELTAILQTQRLALKDAHETTGEYKNLDRVLDLISKTPQTQFSLFIPATSLINTSETEYWAAYGDYIRYLTARLVKLPNAKLFSFTTKKGVVNNNANYLDKGHYGQGVNDYMARAMMNGKCEITNDNVEQHVAEYMDMVETWPFYSDFSTSIAYRESQFMELQRVAKSRGQSVMNGQASSTTTTVSPSNSFSLQ